jgi:glycosyltransferase involved in cell wall biosynthesis
MTMRKIRVLELTGGFDKGTSGGIAAFCFNYFKAMDKTQFTVDFLTIGYPCFDLYRPEIEEMGGTLYCLNVHRFRGLKGKRAYLKAFRAFLAAHSYDVIHVNMGSFYTVLLCAMLARLSTGAKVVAHCHSTMTYQGIRGLSVRLSKPFFYPAADYFLACSIPSGRYMFPSGVVRGGRFHVMSNAISADRFQYDPVARAETRASLGVGEELLIGHVGRFAYAKNHSFLLDVFAEVRRKRPDARLLLVGAGDLEGSIREKARSLGLEGQVIFAGLRGDVHRLMQAMDAFVFPSRFEGLGIVAVEAQASGLTVVASTAVPDDAGICGDQFVRLSLADGAEKWADAVLAACDHPRGDMRQAVADAGYDISREVEKLETLYRSLLAS